MIILHDKGPIHRMENFLAPKLVSQRDAVAQDGCLQNRYKQHNDKTTRLCDKLDNATRLLDFLPVHQTSDQNRSIVKVILRHRGIKRNILCN